MQLYSGQIIFRTRGKLKRQHFRIIFGEGLFKLDVDVNLLLLPLSSTRVYQETGQSYNSQGRFNCKYRLRSLWLSATKYSVV